MSRYARFKVFSITFGAAYLALFFYSEATKAALFRYYPVLGTWTREVLPLETAGPPILWYSWLFGALVVSLAVSGVTPRKFAEWLPPGWVWVAGLSMLVIILVYERRWFY